MLMTCPSNQALRYVASADLIEHLIHILSLCCLLGDLYPILTPKLEWSVDLSETLKLKPSKIRNQVSLADMWA